jgi:hypothetical protein
MSLGIIIKGPEGLVLAAESRVTLTTVQPNGQQLHVNFDNASKLLSFSDPNASIGCVTFGQAAIGIRNVSSFQPEFEAGLPPERLKVEQFAQHLSDFFMGQWNTTIAPGYAGPDISFVCGGYNENEVYGRVYTFNVPSSPGLVEQSPNAFGITWGGQRDIVDRLLQGYDSRIMQIAQQTLQLDATQLAAFAAAAAPVLQLPIPIEFMPLQDHVDLARFFIRTTIDAQVLTVGLRGCGGPIDIAIVTRREGLRFIKRKQITANGNSAANTPS